MATSTITNTITDPSGTALDEVTVVARLMPGAGFRISDSSEVTRRVTTDTDASGAWSLALERNANITPADSWWEIEEQIPEANGGARVWAIQAGVSSPATLLASVVTPAQNPALATYLTQAAADARYEAIGQSVARSHLDLKIDGGATGDGATDDATVTNALITSVGSTSAMRAIDIEAPKGAYKINSSVTFDRKTGRFSGGGAGSVNQLDGATFYWGGSAGSPMFLIKRTWSLVLEGLRFRGKSTAIPSAAIELRSTTGESPTNTNVVLRDIWVGSYGSFDGDNATQFDDGVIVDGDNLQGDQSVIDGLVVQGCENAGLRFDKTQNVLWDVRHFMPNACNYGIQLASKYIIGQDWFCSSNLIADICFSNDASLSVRNFGSEGSVKLATLLGSNAAMSLTLERGYWQVGTNADTSATIDVQPASVSFQQVILRDFNFTDTTGGAKHAIIRARKAKLYLELENVFFGAGTLSNVFDLSMTDAGESRHLVFKNVYIGSTCYNGEWKWFRGDTDPDISLGATGNPRYYRGVLDASGTGDPAGAHIADIGSTWHRTDGGANTSLYVKESGNGANTGWVGK